MKLLPRILKKMILALRAVVNSEHGSFFGDLKENISSQDKKTKLAIYLSSLGIVIFLLIGGTFTFNNELFKSIFLKPFSKAATNDIAPGNLNLTGTFNSIGVELPYQGDLNANSSAKLEFKKSTDSTWREALPLWRTSGGGNGLVDSGQQPQVAGIVQEVSAQAQTPMFYSTLDDAVSVSSPAIGTGAGSSVNTTPANDFVAGQIGNGIQINASSEYARFQQTDGTIQNVELDQGTIDLWYKPSYNSSDGLRHPIISIGSWGATGGGGIFFEKNNGSNSNALTIYTWDNTGAILPKDTKATAYSWTANTWVNLRVTWNTQAGATEPTFNIYVNGSVINTYLSKQLGPLLLNPESTTQYITLGNRSTTGSDNANGVIDDIKIYNSVYPPSGSSTPAPTSQASIAPTAVPTVAPSTTPAPSGNVITINPTTKYQTISGWEATSQAGQADVSFLLFKDTLYDQAVNDLGINRIRVEIRSFCPSQPCPADQPFDLATFDDKLDKIVLPLRQRLAAKGEKLWVNVCVVGNSLANNPNMFAQEVLATVQHMQNDPRYGFVPDSWEILEPGTFSWGNISNVRNAIIAAGDALSSANPPFPVYWIAPSEAGVATGMSSFDSIVGTTTPTLAAPYVKEYSYHRYNLASNTDANFTSIGQTASAKGIGTSMLEHIGSGIADLFKDLKLAENVAWQQYTLAFTNLTDNGGKYYIIDTTNPNSPQVLISLRARLLKHVFKYVRTGAERIDAQTTNSNFDPVSFINKNGNYVVVVRVPTAGGSFTINNLPAGTYGINYTVHANTGSSNDPDYGDATKSDLTHPDQTISSGQSLTTQIPSPGGVVTIYQKGSTSPTPAPSATPIPSATPVPPPTSNFDGAFYGSALLLEPGTQYDIKVTVSDSDGIAGSNIISGSVSTKADNSPSSYNFDAQGNATLNLTPNKFVNANTGSDTTGNGSSSNPWQTINHAINNSAGGEVIQVAPGYYTAPNAENPPSTKDLLITKSLTLVAECPAVRDDQSINNNCSHSVIDSGVVTNANSGSWTQVNLTGTPTNTPRTLWQWTAPFSTFPVVAMGYGSTKAALPKRVASWDIKNNTVTDSSGAVWNMNTPAGWADLLYTNLSYNYGFAQFGQDIYLRLPGDVDPNNYFMTMKRSHSGGQAGGFAFDASNVKFSGFEVRHVGVDFKELASNGKVDHNLFISGGIEVDGVKPGTYGKDYLIEKNRFEDSSLFSSLSWNAANDLSVQDTTIPWHFIKSNIILADQTVSGWARVGAGSGEGLGAESTAIELDGQNVVIRNNTILGYFNGISSSSTGFDRYKGMNTDIHDNFLTQLNDDAFEPEQDVINWRLWNNRVEFTKTVLSTGPVFYGPIYLIKNIGYKLGGEGNVVDQAIIAFNDVSKRNVVNGEVFKYSGTSRPSGCSGTACTTKSRLYVLNNTFWSDSRRNYDGGFQAAGGGGDTERFYLRNNIFRASRYSFSAPANSTGQSDKWDEDYNYFATSWTKDNSHHFNYNSLDQLTMAQYRSNSGQGANTNLADQLVTETLPGGATQQVNFRTLPDPWFSNTTSGNLSLISSAPLIDGGVVVPNITDIAGSNYQGLSPDIGACEGTNCSAPLGGSGPISTPAPSSAPSATPVATPVPTPSPTQSPSSQPSSTPVSTAIPSPSLVASASPVASTTPPPSPTCVLTSANWIYRSPVIEGDPTGLVVQGTNCAGQTLNFEVRESDDPFGLFSLLDDLAKQQPLPNPATFNAAGVAQSTWTAEFECDGDILGVCTLAPPEYYFVATVANTTNSITSSDPKLEVLQNAQSGGGPSPTPSGIVFATPSPSGSIILATSLSVDVKLEGIYSSVPGRTIRYIFKAPDGTIYSYNTTPTVDATGKYQSTLSTLPPPDNYILYIKGWSHLRKKFILDLNSTLTSYDATNTALLAGDINGDDKINALDIGKVIEEYNLTNANTLSDINGDGAVNVLDIGFVINNYLQKGDDIP